MSGTTSSKITASNRIVAALAILAFAFGLSLVLGAMPAYANDNHAQGSHPANSDGVSVLTAAGEDPYPGEDASQAVLLGLDFGGAYSGGVPNGTEQPSSWTSEYPMVLDEDLGYDVPREFSYYDSNNKEVVVNVNTELGTALDLQVGLNYLRVNDTVYDARSYGGGDSATLPTGSEASEVMVSWYYDQAPLARGTYYDNEELYKQSIAGSGSASPGSSLPDPSEDENSGIDARSFISEFQYNYWIPNRIATSSPWSDPGTVPVPMHFSLEAYNHPELFCSGPWRFEIVAQATCVTRNIVRQTATDDNGESYEQDYEWHVVYASNPVRFVVKVVQNGNTGNASLVFDAKDDSGKSVDIGPSSSFRVGVFKQYRSGGSIPSQSDFDYARCQEAYGTDSVSAGKYEVSMATRGFYRISIQDINAKYEPYTKYFVIDHDMIANAYNAGSIITIPVDLKAVAEEVWCTVSFVDDNGDLLKEAKQYLINSLPEAVAKDMPASPTKDEEGEDEGGEYSYAFNGWMLNDETGPILYPVTVTSDQVYKATYRKVYKKSNRVERVFASGGLIGAPLKPGVARIELTGGQIGSNDPRFEAIKTKYSNLISGSLYGIYQVGIKQTNKDGTVSNITEGVGSAVEGQSDLNLSFDVPDVPDGTKVKVAQLHKKDDSDENEEPEVIWHPDLTVANGKVDLSLDDKLSTFIIMAASEQESASGDTPNAEPATPSTGGNQEESTGNAPADVPAPAETPSGEMVPPENTPAPAAESTANDPDTVVGEGTEVVETRGVKASSRDENQDADEGAVVAEGTKAAPAAGEGKLPETGDGSAPAALALASFFSAIAAVIALRRRLLSE